jgi:hypothetical protein
MGSDTIASTASRLNEAGFCRGGALKDAILVRFRQPAVSDDYPRPGSPQFSMPRWRTFRASRNIAQKAVKAAGYRLRASAPKRPAQNKYSKGGFGIGRPVRNVLAEGPLFACAVRRRRFPVGKSPTRRTLQRRAPVRHRLLS